MFTGNQERPTDMGIYRITLWMLGAATLMLSATMLWLYVWPTTFEDPWTPYDNSDMWTMRRHDEQDFQPFYRPKTNSILLIQTTAFGVTIRHREAESAIVDVVDSDGATHLVKVGPISDQLIVVFMDGTTSSIRLEEGEVAQHLKWASQTKQEFTTYPEWYRGFFGERRVKPLFGAN